jgi:hypothetical protein
MLQNGTRLSACRASRANIIWPTSLPNHCLNWHFLCSANCSWVFKDAWILEVLWTVKLQRQSATPAGSWNQHGALCLLVDSAQSRSGFWPGKCVERVLTVQEVLFASSLLHVKSCVFSILWSLRLLKRFSIHMTYIGDTFLQRGHLIYIGPYYVAFVFKALYYCAAFVLKAALVWLRFPWETSSEG